MNATAALVRDCILAGAIFSLLGALVVAPYLALIAARVIAPRIIRMRDDPLWQAPLAAAAAAIPGAIFLAIATYGLIAGWRSACMQLLAGKVLYAAMAVIIGAALLRALTLVFADISQTRKLLSASRPPSNRLAEISRRAGIAARELDTPYAFFALVGLARPVVVVSTVVLARLSDAQLYAALAHEAAHRDRRDGALALALLFFSSLMPVRMSPLIDLYRRAREVAADYLAVRATDRFDLASAITVTARATCAAMPALSGDGNVRQRICRLIEARDCVPDARSRTCIVLWLALTASFGFVPLWAVGLQLISCTGVASR